MVILCQHKTLTPFMSIVTKNTQLINWTTHTTSPLQAYNQERKILQSWIHDRVKMLGVLTRLFDCFRTTRHTSTFRALAWRRDMQLSSWQPSLACCQHIDRTHISMSRSKIRCPSIARTQRWLQQPQSDKTTMGLSSSWLISFCADAARTHRSFSFVVVASLSLFWFSIRLFILFLIPCMLISYHKL